MAAMVSSGMASILGVPTADDTMEISSDAGRGDQDLDFDFMGDDNGNSGNDGNEDIDWMLQDAASERGNEQAPEQQTRTDDIMYDDGDEVNYIEEDTMEDDISGQSGRSPETHDLDIQLDADPATEETLFDATEHVDVEADDAYQEPEEEALIDYETLDDQGEQQFNAQETEPALATSALEEPRQMEHIDAALPVEFNHEQHLAPLEDVVERTATPEESASLAFEPVEEKVSQTAVQADFTAVQEVEEVEAVAQPAATLERTSSHETDTATAIMPQALLEEPAKAPIQSSTNALPPMESASEGQMNAQHGALHPVTVNYASSVEYSLFPMSEQDDPNSCLLQDSSVASSSLVDFFRACRSVLDQDLNDTLELELYIDSLNLTIPEDSTHCRDTSLAQLVEVYVQLMHNAGTEQPPALYMELNTRERLSAQLTNLFKAASEKRGLYDLHFYQDETQEGLEESPEHSEGEDGEQLQGEREEQTGELHTAEISAATVKDESKHEDEKEMEEEQVESTFTADEGAVPEIVRATHDSAQQVVSEYQESKKDDEAEAGPDHHESVEDENHEQGAVEGITQQLSVTDAWQGNADSSGSSTIQEEIYPQLSNIDDDTSSQPAQANDDYAAGQGFDDAEHVDVQNFDDTAAESGVPDSFDFTKFGTNEEYGADVDYHEEAPLDGDEDENAHQGWAQEDTQTNGDDPTAIGNGTFEVPDGSDEADEDEITFNDDEFAPDDDGTQEATTQEAPETSPLGKRSREEDEGGLLDGSDQESKRLKAA